MEKDKDNFNILRKIHSKPHYSQREISDDLGLSLGKINYCLLDVDDVAPRLSFFFNSHSDFFEEICKYRAARRIWAKQLKNKYGRVCYKRLFPKSSCK